MELNARIYVAGHRGLAGSALARRLASGGFRNLLGRTHTELELTDQTAVRKFFEQEKPAYVFIAAAKVGGILANNNFPAEFIQSNLAVQTNVIHEAWRNGVKRLLFLGSSCIYPRDCAQPIKEEYLLTGPLEFTNRAYAVAKIAGVEMCRSYNRQYGTRYLCAMPTSLAPRAWQARMARSTRLYGNSRDTTRKNGSSTGGGGAGPATRSTSMGGNTTRASRE